MDFGQEFNVGPQLPKSAQPGSMPSLIPGEAPQNFGSLFGGAAPKMAAAPAPAPQGDESQGPTPDAVVHLGSGRVETPEPTFGSLEEKTSPVFPKPGQGKTYEQKDATITAQADKMVDTLRAGLKGEEAKAAEGKEKDEEFNAFIEQMKGELTQKPALENQFNENSPRQLPGSDPNAPIQTRIAQQVKHNLASFASGLGRNPKESMGTLRDIYGEDNVQLKKGKVYISQDPPGTPDDKRTFRPFSTMNPVEFLSGFSGPIIEGAVSSAVEAAGLVGTAVTTGMTSMTPAAPLATAVGAAGIAGSAIAGGVAGAFARDGAIRLTDMISGGHMRDEDVSLFNESAWNAGFNLAGLAGGALVKPVGKLFQKIVDTFPENRIKALRDVLTGFDDFAKTFGVSINIPGATRKGARAVGNETFDAIDKYGDNLQSAVTLVKQKAIDLAESQGRKGVSTEGLLSKLKEQIDNYGVGYREDGTAFIKSKEKAAAQGMDPFQWDRLQEKMPPDMRSSPASRPVSSADQLSEKASTMHAFGSKNGEKTLQLFVDQYNGLLGAKNGADGGIALNTLMDFVDNYSHLSKYDKMNPGMYTPQEIAAFRQLRHAADGDRHQVFQQLFQGSGLPEEEIYQSAFKDYSSNIASVLQFRSQFNRQESASLFAKAMVQPEQVERLEGLRSILGADSPEWHSFRGEAIANLIDKSILPSSGILNGSHLLENMNHLGKDVMNTLLSKEEQGVMKKMAIATQRIGYTDLLSNNDKDVLEYVVALSPLRQFETSRMKVLWAMIGKNKLAADYLLNEGFMSAASRAPDKAAQTSILRAKRFMSEMVSKMQVATIDRVDPKTGVKKAIQIYVPTIKNAASQALKSATIHAQGNMAPKDAEAAMKDSDQESMNPDLLGE